LGIQADISSDQLLFLPIKKTECGVGLLVINDELSQAASAKADDMFQYNYWAHNSPSGKTPGHLLRLLDIDIFTQEKISQRIYDYAERNRCWMASPDHRANMLSSNYQDVGFAVKSGNLNGEDTVLVVEEFGNLYMPVAKNTPQEIAPAKNTVASVPAPVVPVPVVQKTVQAVSRKPLINTSTLSSNIYYVFILVFIFALFLDMIIIEKKKVMRFVGTISITYSTYCWYCH